MCERVGNASVDQLLINLKLLGIIDRDLKPLARFVHAVSESYGVPIPYNYPVFGTDAFRTATGVHAAAIVKAQQLERTDLADRVYSSVPAVDFGCRQRIEVGFYSGKANVTFWLREHGLAVTDPVADAIFALAKASRVTLDDETIFAHLASEGLLEGVTPGTDNRTPVS